jgi:hypothetical protein
MGCILYITQIESWGDENYIQNLDEKTSKGTVVFWNVTLRRCMKDS